MKRKVLVRFFLVPVMIFGLIGIANAQDINAAAEAYNTASDLKTTDPASAIASAENCLEICDQIGTDAADVKEKAEKLLPQLHFNLGNSYIKAKKYNDAIAAFKETLTVAEKYKNEEVIVKAKTMLPKLYNSIGGAYYKKSDFNKALENLNQAVVYDPDYAKAYYTMGLVYKKMNDPVNFELTADKGVSAAKNSKDSNTEGLIAKAASNFFLAAGSEALEGNPAEAAEMFTKALKYDAANVDTYFYLASAQIGAKSFDAAIEAANKALELEGEDQEKNAKHYYNLGLAYKGKNDKNAACEAFNKALFGQFKDNAQYEIEHELKCNE